MPPAQTLLLSFEYFPSIAWYAAYLQAGDVFIDQEEYFQRASMRNRCYVAGAQGRQALTVPLQGGRNQHTRMKDLRISYHERWSHQHLKTLEACYGRSPYYDFILPEIEPLLTHRWEWLTDLLFASLQRINQVMRIQKPVSFLSNANMPDGATDLRRAWKASSPGHPSALRYTQPFEERHGFIPGLSMLDLLFCTGLQALPLLSEAEK